MHMITQHLGNRIRELRNKTGLSQEKFALKIGIDRTYFASIDGISLHTWWKISIFR